MKGHFPRPQKLRPGIIYVLLNDLLNFKVCLHYCQIETMSDTREKGHVLRAIESVNWGTVLAQQERSSFSFCATIFIENSLSMTKNLKIISFLQDHGVCKVQNGTEEVISSIIVWFLVSIVRFRIFPKDKHAFVSFEVCIDCAFSIPRQSLAMCGFGYNNNQLGIQSLISITILIQIYPLPQNFLILTTKLFTSNPDDNFIFQHQVIQSC